MNDTLKIGIDSNNGNNISDSFQIELLFENKVVKPDSKDIFKLAEKIFGNIDIINSDKKLTTFAVKKYISYFKDKTVPVQLSMGDVESFSMDKNISEFELSQIHNVENPENIFSNYKYSIKIFDMFANGQIPKERAEMLVYWLEIAVSLFPECKAVWIKSSGKLHLAKTIKNFNETAIIKFIHNMVNMRFFNLSDENNKNEFIIDSTGLAAIGLSDVQFHFKGINPNNIIKLAYNLAWYLLNDESIIRDGDTIDGLDDNGKMNSNIQWICRYEDSLVEPLRSVLDIEAGKYAAGTRE